MDAKPEGPAPKLVDYAESAAVQSLGEAFIHRLPHVEDLRGSLSFGETFRNVPFEMRRYFLVHGVQENEFAASTRTVTCTSFWYAWRGGATW